MLVTKAQLDFRSSQRIPRRRCACHGGDETSFSHALVASVQGFVDPAVSSQPVDTDTREGRHGSDHH